MKLSQKRTCTGCRALETWRKLYTASCELKKQIKPGKNAFGMTVNYVPCEPCMKPKTIDEYLELTRIKQ